MITFNVFCIACGEVNMQGIPFQQNHLKQIRTVGNDGNNFPSYSLFLFFDVCLGDDVDATDFDGPDKVLVAQYTHAQISLHIPTEFASGATSTIPRILEHGDVGDVPESHGINHKA